MSKSQTNAANAPLDVNVLGGGIKILDKTEVKLTPRFAEDFLDLAEFLAERGLRKHWADHLAMEMLRGNFRFEHVLLAQAELNGTVYRMNGQHCCWARLEFKDNPAFSQPVRLVKYRVQNEEDLRNLYSVFDQHGKRTRGHVIMAQLAGYQGWASVTKKFITLVSQGFPLWRWEFPNERNHDTRDHALLLKTDFLELGVRVGRFLTEKASGKDCRHLHRGPVVAAMLGSFAKAAGPAEEFWLPIADGTGFAAKEDPRNRLRAELLATAVGVGGRNRDKKNVSQEHMLRMCIAGWNAWRAGEKRQMLRVDLRGPRPKFR